MTHEGENTRGVFDRDFWELLHLKNGAHKHLSRVANTQGVLTLVLCSYVQA